METSSSILVWRLHGQRSLAGAPVRGVARMDTAEQLALPPWRWVIPAAGTSSSCEWKLLSACGVQGLIVAASPVAQPGLSGGWPQYLWHVG